MASLRQLRATWIANSLSPRQERDLPSPMYRNVESFGTSAAPHHITSHLQVNEYLTKEHVNSFVIYTHNFLSGECVSYISTVSQIKFSVVLISNNNEISRYNYLYMKLRKRGGENVKKKEVRGKSFSRTCNINANHKVKDTDTPTQQPFQLQKKKSQSNTLPPNPPPHP